MWYQTMGLAQDDDVDFKGAVLVLYTVGLPPSAAFDLELMKKASGLPQAVPFSPAVHFCYDDYRLTPLISLFQMGAGKTTRLRFRTHFGECEVAFAFACFGHFNNRIRANNLILSVRAIFNLHSQVLTKNAGIRS
jgi:hypothetical protein